MGILGQSRAFRALSDDDGIVRDGRVRQRLAVPAPDGAGVGAKFHSDLLPRVVVDVAILQGPCARRCPEPPR